MRTSWDGGAAPSLTPAWDNGGCEGEGRETLAAGLVAGAGVLVATAAAVGPGVWFTLRRWTACSSGEGDSGGFDGMTRKPAGAHQRRSSGGRAGPAGVAGADLASPLPVTLSSITRRMRARSGVRPPPCRQGSGRRRGCPQRGPPTTTLPAIRRCPPPSRRAGSRCELKATVPHPPSLIHVRCPCDPAWTPNARRGRGTRPPLRRTARVYCGGMGGRGEGGVAARRCHSTALTCYLAIPGSPPRGRRRSLCRPTRRTTTAAADEIEGASFAALSARPPFSLPFANLRPGGAPSCPRGRPDQGDCGRRERLMLP